jgi:hypothetical protein
VRSLAHQAVPGFPHPSILSPPRSHSAQSFEIHFQFEPNKIGIEGSSSKPDEAILLILLSFARHPQDQRVSNQST